MTVVAVTILLSGLLVLGLSVPLMLRKVPMNAFYGIRLAASFESQERWYEINAYGGRLLALWSLAIIATGVAGFFVPRAYRDVYGISSGVITVVAVLIPTFQVMWWSRRRG